MKFFILSMGLLLAVNIRSETAPNTLSDAETQAGWKLLWDGKTTEGWRSLGSDKFPSQGWEIKDGELSVLGKKGGDIITTKSYVNFELKAEFKLTPGANSGIKYFIQPEKTKSVGFEYQILDDAKHPDAKAGISGNRTIASLYDMVAARTDKKPKPIGEWNVALIVVKGDHVEHWLNGAKVVAIDRTSPDFKAHFEASKFKKDTGFITRPGGHILLQDHGNLVSFRSLKIRELP